MPAIGRRFDLAGFSYLPNSAWLSTITPESLRQVVIIPIFERI
jgi:hypothetical protein